MFKNLFDYEERENVIEFVEEETIETVEELDTLLSKTVKLVQEAGQIVVNTGIITVLLAGKAVKGVAKGVIKTTSGIGKLALNTTKLACNILTYPIVKPIKILNNKKKHKRLITN